MKVIFHKDFYQVYTGDPAAAPGRMESIVKKLAPGSDFVQAVPATRQQIAAVHTDLHIQDVERQGLYEIAALAAGGAIQSAQIGLTEPCFGLIRPPGHHASSSSAWGFCYFNNMAVALEEMRNQHQIQKAAVLDIDLHFGDGTVNILGKKSWSTVFNFDDSNRNRYLSAVEEVMNSCQADLIGISAGFDNHLADWGGLLRTDDYEEIGRLVRAAAIRNGTGYFAILEGGYNHQVLGDNALALVRGMAGK